PGKTSRDYGNGDVVYMKGVSLSDSGYFMALGDVKAGTKITDTSKATSNWIRLADKGGQGFAEAFPSAADYDSTTTKYNSRGERVAYLKGDVVRVPAHWANPGSYMFLEAQADVPQGIALEKVFNDNHVGENKFFNYVGQDRSNGAITGDKPTTEYVRANSNLAEPSVYTSGSASGLKSLMAFNSTSNHTPGYVKVGNDVYVANNDWNVKTWTGGVSFKEGELIFDETPGTANEHVKEISSKVKGIYTGAGATQDDYVLHQGNWFQASTTVAKSTVPVDPASVNKAHGVNATDTAFVAGDKILDGTNVYTAPSTVRGNFDASDVQLGSYVLSGGAWHQISATQAGIANFQVAAWADATVYAANDIIEHNGTYYKSVAGNTGSLGLGAPDVAGSGWSVVTNAADLGVANAGWNNLASLTGAGWVKSPWDIEA
ncbi:uncharacterized protein METZ01_LOCUS269896, partial [marine metagenome]